MHLTNLSWQPLKPCILLKWPNTTILLDCALDFSSLNHFLPHSYNPANQAKRCSSFLPGEEFSYLKKIRENVYVDGLPEVHPTPLEYLSMDSVDYILVSNWNSLVALPFYVNNTGFKGKIFATHPVLQFGKLMMMELVEYFARMTCEEIDDKWKDPNIYSQMPNIPIRNPVEWKPFYTKEIMEATLEAVTNISFKQTMTVHGNISITAYNSGHHIGSSNWVLLVENNKIAYLASSSVRATHTKSVDWDKMREADTLILTSLSPVPDNDPMSNILAAREVVLETLKRGGNALLPVAPVGGIYDILDVIVKGIEDTNGVSLDTPVYFISPVAKGAIAYSNVNAEWLSDEKQNSVYVPEEPFKHAQLVRDGRIKVYESLYDSFSRDYKTPCVIVCGHPSLRIGDAAHMVEMWGNDNRNALIMTNPDFPLPEVYGPFEGLSIRAYYYPIDTRLDYTQLNTAILPDLKPKSVYVPDAYMMPLVSGRQDLMVHYSTCTPMRYGETLLVSSKRAKKRKIKLHPDIIKKLEAKTHPASSEYGICALSGMLSVYDEAYELLPVKKRVGALRPRYTGRLSPEMISKALQKRNLSVRQVVCEDGGSEIHIDSMKAVIRLNIDGLRTVIQAAPEHRAQLIDAVTSYLSVLC